MSAEILVSRFRSFLLVTAGLCCVASVLELWLEEHTGSLPQLIPFYLCGLGAAAIVIALIPPQRVTLKLLRNVMGAMLVGSLFGLFEHVEHNWEFQERSAPTQPFRFFFPIHCMGPTRCWRRESWPLPRLWPSPQPTITPR